MWIHRALIKVDFNSLFPTRKNGNIEYLVLENEKRHKAKKKEEEENDEENEDMIMREVKTS